MKNFAEATLHVCDCVEELVVDGRLNLPEMSFAEASLPYLNGLKEVIPEPDVIYYILEPATARWLYDTSHHDSDVYDALVHVCRMNLLANRDLPFELRYFTSQVLEGTFVVPKKMGRRPRKIWLERSFLLTLTFETAHRFGLVLTRNDASQPHSACDAVAQALTVCGRKTSVGELKNLCVHDDFALLRAQSSFLARLAVGHSEVRVGELDHS